MGCVEVYLPMAGVRSWFVGLSAALALVAVLAGCSGGSSGAVQRSVARTNRLAGLVTDPAPDVGSLSLPDASQGGRDLPFVAQPGQVLLVYFGYTSCPDICPTTLADLHHAIAGLPVADRGRVQMAMVTIDPARDTPAVLQAYLAHFFPSGHPLATTDQARLAAAAAAFGARYDVTVGTSGEESVGHSALVYAVDRHGQVVDAWPFGVDSSVVINDLRILLRRSGTA